MIKKSHIPSIYIYQKYKIFNNQKEKNKKLYLDIGKESETENLVHKLTIIKTKYYNKDLISLNKQEESFLRFHRPVAMFYKMSYFYVNLLLINKNYYHPRKKTQE